MSCPRTAEIQRRLSPAELSAFTEHASACEECGRMLRRMDDAVRLLRADEVSPLPPGKRVELLSAVEAKAGRRPRPLLWVAPLAVAAIVAAVMLFPKSAPDPRPRVIAGPVTIASGALVDGALIQGAAKAGAGARIRFSEAELSVLDAADLSFTVEAVEMVRGEICFEVAQVDRAAPFAVQTPLARIEVVGTRFTLAVSRERTEVTVDRGRVRVIPMDGSPRILDAGGALTVERPVAAVPPPPPAPPSVAPPPRPPPKKTPPKKTRKAKKKRAEVRSKSSPRRQAERLDEARRVVRKDAARARALAEGVLEEKPAPVLEIGALLVLADAHRRSGDAIEAAAAYAKVAGHPKGGPYVEEALYRRAQMLAARDPEAALAALAQAAARTGAGSLGPERAVLEARLRLDRGDVSGAAAAVEGREDRTLALLRMRVKIAEALVGRDSARAKALVAPFLEAGFPPALSARARRIAGEAGP